MLQDFYRTRIYVGRVMEQQQGLPAFRETCAEILENSIYSIEFGAELEYNGGGIAVYGYYRSK